MRRADLRKRLDALAPPVRLVSRDAPAPDPLMLRAMRDYLAGRVLAVPGLSDEAQRAMNDYIASNESIDLAGRIGALELKGQPK